MQRDTVQIGHRFDQAEPKSTARRRAALLQPVETLENTFVFFGRHTRAIVGHCSDDALAIATK